jgi:hypothetical protein
MQLLEACAWCERIRLDQWIEPGEALRRLRTYEWPEPPQFSHVACDGCLERLVRRHAPAPAEPVAI